MKKKSWRRGTERFIGSTEGRSGIDYEAGERGKGDCKKCLEVIY